MINGFSRIFFEYGKMFFKIDNAYDAHRVGRHSKHLRKNLGSTQDIVPKECIVYRTFSAVLKSVRSVFSASARADPLSVLFRSARVLRGTRALLSSGRPARFSVWTAWSAGSA